MTIDKGWVITEIPNRMKDPGDGSIHETPVITVLAYAGDGKWSYEEDAYNPMNFLTMVQEYIAAMPRSSAPSPTMPGRSRRT